MNKTELQEEHSRLLLEQENILTPLTFARNETQEALNRLLKEIAENPNTPTEIVELAKTFEQKQQAEIAVDEKVINLVVRARKIREALFAAD